MRWLFDNEGFGHLLEATKESAAYANNQQG